MVDAFNIVILTGTRASTYGELATLRGPGRLWEGQGVKNP